MYVIKDITAFSGNRNLGPPPPIEYFKQLLSKSCFNRKLQLLKLFIFFYISRNHTCRKTRIWGSKARSILRFDIALGPFDVAWGPFDVAWQKLWLKIDIFDEILGCSGHLTSPEKKWAPIAVKIFYKYAQNGWGGGGDRVATGKFRRGGGRVLEKSVWNCVFIEHLVLTPIGAGCFYYIVGRGRAFGGCCERIQQKIIFKNVT